MKALERPTIEPERKHPPDEPTAPAGRVLVAMFVCLATWILLAAPSLERAAESAPLGARRTVALFVLRPLSWVGDATGIGDAGDGLLAALGRDADEAPGGELDLSVAPPPPLEIPRVVPPAPRPTEEGRRVLVRNRERERRRDRTRRPSLRAPTPRDPLRVAVIGDSFADGLGPALGRALDPKLVNAQIWARLGTGLARRDYFDWPASAQKIVARFKPDLVIVMMGANDDQSVVVSKTRAIAGGTPAWRAAYATRIRAVIGPIVRGGGFVIWAGLPPMPEGRRPGPRTARGLDSLYRRETASFPKRAAYLDTFSVFSRGGRYSAFGEDASGDLAQLRAEDRVHLTVAGYELLAARILEAATDHWKLAASARR